jgi:hypothetical protein
MIHPSEYQLFTVITRIVKNCHGNARVFMRLTCSFPRKKRHSAESPMAQLPGSGMQVKGKSSATRKPPGGQWIKEQYTDGSGPIPVIGQGWRCR